jgi:hypothetical protein
MRESGHGEAGEQRQAQGEASDHGRVCARKARRGQSFNVSGQSNLPSRRQSSNQIANKSLELDQIFAVDQPAASIIARMRAGAYL